MTVEAATYIADLDHQKPNGDLDQVMEGDDHLRLIKQVLKNTFPGLAGAFNRTIPHTVAADYVVQSTESQTLHLWSMPAYHGFWLPPVASVPDGFTVSLTVGAGYPQVGIRVSDAAYLAITELTPGHICTFIKALGGWFCLCQRLNYLAAAAADITTLSGTLSAAPGTRMLFHQAAAPAGWVIDATYNDRVIRVNSGGGQSSGGSWQITGLYAVGTALTEAHLPVILPRLRVQQLQVGIDPNILPLNYSLLRTDIGGASGYVDPIGGGAAHGHGVGQDGSWRPAYTDCIICVKA